MNVARFEDMISRLRQVPVDNFNMDRFLCGSLEGLHNHECGSTGCVLGWCCAWYPEAFHLNGHGVVVHANINGCTAGCKWLDLPWEDFKIFGPDDTRPTPSIVADRLQAYLDKYREDPTKCWHGYVDC